MSLSNRLLWLVLSGLMLIGGGVVSTHHHWGLDPLRDVSPHAAIQSFEIARVTLTPPNASSVGLRRLQVQSVAELERLFDQLGYTWPPAPGTSVPRVAVDPLPRDFHQIASPAKRKSLFMRILLPMVLAENERVQRERAYALRLLDGNLPPAHTLQYRWLETQLRRYDIRGNLTHPDVRAQLLQRLDVVPVSLALAQAASESGWGSSRLARENNNLFGHMSREFDGLTPIAMGKNFHSLQAAIEAYINNLNTTRAYQGLWRQRALMRQTGEWLDPMQLAGSLVLYSERGWGYVQDIQALMRENKLLALREVSLRNASALAEIPPPAPTPRWLAVLE